MKKNSNKINIFYRLLRIYFRFFHNFIFYNKVYVINGENVPKNGVPLLIVGNHQNCLNDPLLVVMTLLDRKLHVLARADAFKNPIAKKFLYFIGLLPAFRLNYDGENLLSKNVDTFEAASDELIKGNTVMLYPEAGHQDKHWLGAFSLGYTKLAFEAAEKTGFKEEIFILPSCNHYSNYWGIQHDSLVKYGTPISITPYYELYKEKPRTAQRNVNELVRSQIESMMLNINDLENYHSIDYIRESYGIKFAKDNGFNPNILPEKLESDKLLVAKLEKFKEKNKNLFEKICNNVSNLKESTFDLNHRDWNFEKKFNIWKIILKFIMYIVCIPIFALQLPNLLLCFLPKIFIKQIVDKMFINSIYFGFNVLFGIPIVYTLSFIMCFLMTESFLISMIYIVALPFLGLFSFKIFKSFLKWDSEVRFKLNSDRDKYKSLITLRNSIFSTLDKELKNIC